MKMFIALAVSMALSACTVRADVESTPTSTDTGGSTTHQEVSLSRFHHGIKQVCIGGGIYITYTTSTGAAITPMLIPNTNGMITRCRSDHA